LLKDEKKGFKLNTWYC